VRKRVQIWKGQGARRDAVLEWRIISQHGDGQAYYYCLSLHVHISHNVPVGEPVGEPVGGLWVPVGLASRKSQARRHMRSA
jgi:hypothetical protein